MAYKETIQDKIRRAKLQLGDDFGDEEMMEEAIFKAGVRTGEKKGLKEVVEWIEKNKAWEEEHYRGQTIGSPDSTGGVIPLTETYYLISKDKLQAKLKEWGITSKEQITDRLNAHIEGIEEGHRKAGDSKLTFP